jgi:phosphoglycolate phosphatase
MHRERVTSDAAIMICDRQMDVAAATSNGMRTVGVTWGYGSVDELTAAGAAALCATPSALAQAALSQLGIGGKFGQETGSPVQLSHR